MKTVLVVDDKDMMRDSVGQTLERAGFEVVTATGGAAAVELCRQRRPDAIVTDMRMPGMTGIELLEQVRKIDEDLPVVVMTAFGTIDTAVRAMKLGAFDYLTKPFEGDELVITVKRAVEHAGLLRENALLRATAPCAPSFTGGQASRLGLDRLIGSSPAIAALRDQIPAIAASSGTVLVTGESGVGKEVVARAIHESGPRSGAPFLAVNCAALSESLLESELFGHERGAFTGAEKLRKGRFELADRGTLLLDEVSEVSPKIQAKLLRVLQERAFERVGSSTSIGVDVRVIATSNRDLPQACEKGEFRQDLFYRLNVLPVRVAPLRDRAADVTDLATHFVSLVCRREGRTPLAWDPAALDALRHYTWPGNVRELQNICERAVVLGGAAGVITPELVGPWLSGSAPRPVLSQLIEAKPAADQSAPPGPRVLEDIEREAIVRTLQMFHGHRQKSAGALGIGVRTLGLKLKKWKKLGLVEPNL